MHVPPDVVARATEHAKVRRTVVREDLPADIGIVHDGTRFRFYSADAWEPPEGEQPFLPWSPPAWPRIATVSPDGTLTLDIEGTP